MLAISSDICYHTTVVSAKYAVMKGKTVYTRLRRQGGADNGKM